ncbi:extracellular solute-binding protein [Clostridium sp.]|uniref:extracellular solute-binding protein n=1 Tax=Clostridium sp. TaxID=1506 RepID=UPI0026278B43|nr:extracellular solute-binding protein [uncultured Clostridium sp.]
MKFKKLCSLFLVTSMLAISFSGCGTKSSSSQTKAVDPKALKGDIELMLPAGDYIDYVKKSILPEFKKQYPNIKVTVTDDKNIDTRIDAGDAPSVYAGVWGAQPIKYAKMDKLVNYDNFKDYSALAQRIDSKYLGKVLDGTYYVPMNATTQMMIYNKDLFKEAGLDPEKPPVTFDEYLTYAKKISELPKRKDGSKTYGTVFWNEALTFGGWYWTMLAQEYYNMNGGKYQLLNKLGTDVVFDKPAANLDKFFKFSQDAQKLAPPTMEKNFFSRSIGMWSQFGYGWKANLKQALGKTMVIGKDVGIAPMPVLKVGDRSVSTIDGRALMIFKTNKEKETMSWALVKFLMQDKQNLDACKQLGQLPTLKSLVTDPYFQTPDNKPFLDQLKTGIPNEGFAESDGIQNIMLQTYQKVVIKKSLTPEQGVKEAAVKSRKLLSTTK